MKTDPAAIRRASEGHNLELSLDSWGRLTLITPEGRRYNGVEPVRAFPMTDPTRWISFTDQEGKEVYCLRSVEGLDPAVKRLLDDEISRREFVPVIQRIKRVSGEGTPSEWDVETDRGPTRFTLDSEDDIRNLGPHRVLITDARKLRYQIPDILALDGHSRRLLDRFL
jgi:hypothetical protein